MAVHNERDYPDILFKVDGSLYSINSKNVLFISPMPKFSRIPGAAEGVSGIMKFRDQIVPLVDLRVLFGVHTLQQEYDEFVEMLEKRKNDHIRWVDELEKSMTTGDAFTLATDPHMCAFGKWYDNFHTDSHVVEFHMKKVEEPHRKLHEAAEKVNSCTKEHEKCTRKTCLKEVFEQVKEEYMPEVLNVLEEAKSVFKSTYTEMVIVIENSVSRVGLIVDEVLSIETLKEVPASANALSFNHSEYINTAKQMDNTTELVLDLNDGHILNKFSNVKIDEKSEAVQKLKAMS